MLQLTAALQTLVIGAVLLASARLKLFDRDSAATARRTALATLLGENRAPAAYRLVGLVELAIGGLLLVPPVWTVEPLAASVLAVGFLGFLGYARLVVPESSCGCLSAQRTPVAGRSFARAGFLVAAGLFAAFAADGRHWLSALVDRPIAGLGLLLGEAALVVALSSELDRHWLVPLRQLRVRLTNPLRGGTGVPLLASVQQLQRSAGYRQVSRLLTSDVRDHWEADDWRMVSYAGRYQGRPVTAVFAVPLREYDPDRVRVALVDEWTGATVATLVGSGQVGSGQDGSGVAAEPTGPAAPPPARPLGPTAGPVYAG